MLAGPAIAGAIACDASNVMVDAQDKADSALACQGAQDAINFLISQGLRVPTTLTLKIAAKLPPELPATALGAFQRQKQLVVVISYRSFLSRRDMFRVPLDQSLYRAIVAHEVAHAIADHNFLAPPSLLALEYIAYVTFFSSLPPAQREKILQPYWYDPEWPLYADALYLEDHLDFGAHAYWHFVRPENGPDYFRKLLAGQELPLN
ncbi:MAG TPA: DUF6639 family protein [Noviherbaspirillum sp.]